MPASVALKVTCPGDVRPLPPTVTRSVSATQASCVEAMVDWVSMKVRCRPKWRVESNVPVP